jgi:hypothetical protein
MSKICSRTDYHGIHTTQTIFLEHGQDFGRPDGHVTNGIPKKKTICFPLQFD